MTLLLPKWIWICKAWLKFCFLSYYPLNLFGICFFDPWLPFTPHLVVYLIVLFNFFQLIWIWFLSQRYYSYLFYILQTHLLTEASWFYQRFCDHVGQIWTRIAVALFSRMKITFPPHWAVSFHNSHSCLNEVVSSASTIFILLFYYPQFIVKNRSHCWEYLRW